MRLDEPSHVWILRIGHAELFVRRGGSQRPLGLVDAPGCLPGTGNPDIVIEAKLSEDAEIEPISFDRLLAEPELLRLALVDAHILLASFGEFENALPTPQSVPELHEWQSEFSRRLEVRFVAHDAAEFESQALREEQAGAALKRATEQLASVLAPIDAEASPAGADPLLAAMKKVGAANGIEIHPQPMADSYPTLPLRVQAIARVSRCRIRQVTLTPKWWLGEHGPLLGFLQGTASPVALLPTRSGYRIEDPSGSVTGKISADTTLSPVAFVLYRGFAEDVVTWKQVAASALRDNWREAILIVIMAALVGLLGLVTPFATQLIFDHAIPSGLSDQLWHLGAGMTVAALGTAAFSLVQGFLLLRIETKADRDVQSGVVDRILRLPAPFFRLYSVGDLANRTMSIDGIRRIISSIGVTTLLGTVSALFNFFILFRYGLELSLLAVGLGLVALAVTVSINLWSLRYARRTEDLEGSVSGFVNQLIAGIAKLRVTGTAALAFAEWAERFAEKSRLRLRMRRIQNVLAVFNVAFPPLATLLIFWFAFQRLTGSSAAFTTGDFLAYSTAFGTFLGAMLAFSGATIQAIMVLPLYERAKPILQTPPEAGAAQSWPGELTGDVDLRHVTFRYAMDGPPVLEDINLTIRPGEFVAVVGPSGSGKSTLLRLLLGFEQPESGSIYYSGQALPTLDCIEVRRQIGVVLQSSRPLSGDILGNIASNSGASLEQAWEAAEMAGLAEDIRAMPMGMHTIVNGEGGGLSGGQRQRLMIARAVVNNPRILFFDEATSALDNETQAHVAAGLAKLKATRLVIAHRLSTIASADRIIVIRGGTIAEEGTYAELMARQGYFFELANRQLA